MLLGWGKGHLRHPAVQVLYGAECVVVRVADRHPVATPSPPRSATPRSRHRPAFKALRAMARAVTKPVITRALDSMGKQEIIARRRDEADRRNVIIQRTVKGALYVESLGDLIVEKASHIPNRG
jgi:hypothetical protein